MKRVLIIDDEPAIAISTGMLLECEGFGVAGVASGVDEALDLIEQGGVDAAVIDASLNGASAQPIAERLRQMNTPFLVVSGRPSESMPWIDESAFLLKPVEPETFIRTLNRVCAGGSDAN